MPFLVPVVIGAASAAGGAAAAVGGTALATAGTIAAGAAGVAGSVISTAGAIGAGAVGAAGTAAVAGTKAVSGIVAALPGVVQSAKPIAEVLGQAYGVYATLEQQKLARKQLQLAQKTGGTAMANPTWQTIADQILKGISPSGMGGPPASEPGAETTATSGLQLSTVAIWGLIGYVIYKAVIKK